MSPITAKATLRRTLEHHIKCGQATLSLLGDNLRLCGIDPEADPTWKHHVAVISAMQGRLAILIMADVMVNAAMYSESRGFHP